jgi:hypothetical protein
MSVADGANLSNSHAAVKKLVIHAQLSEEPQNAEAVPGNVCRPERYGFEKVG